MANIQLITIPGMKSVAARFLCDEMWLIIDFAGVNRYPDVRPRNGAGGADDGQERQGAQAR